MTYLVHLAHTAKYKHKLTIDMTIDMHDMTSVVVHDDIE